MKIVQSPSLARTVRKLQKREKASLDRQIRKIAEDPTIGQEKRGDLRSVFVYTFKIHSTQYLLSYRVKDANTLELIMLGAHENYYRDLSNYLKGRG